MNTYPTSLYKEILKDYYYRFPRYNAIDYPNLRDNTNKVKQTVPVLNPKPIRKLPK